MKDFNFIKSGEGKYTAHYNDMRIIADLTIDCYQSIDYEFNIYDKNGDELSIDEALSGDELSICEGELFELKTLEFRSV